MLYNSGTSEPEQLKEIDQIRSYLSAIDGSYTWIQIKKDLQEYILPKHRNISTWSSEKRVDQVLIRKVCQEQLSASVIGPPSEKKSRLSPE